MVSVCVNALVQFWSSVHSVPTSCPLLCFQGRLEVFQEYYRNARLEQLRLVVGETDLVSHTHSTELL